MRDGSTRTIEVSRVDEASICGRGTCLARDALSAIERREIDGVRTTLLVVGLVGLVAVAVAAGRGFAVMPGPPTFP